MFKFFRLTMILNTVGILFLLLTIKLLPFIAGIILLVFGMFLLIIAVAFLIKIWRVDPNSDGAKLIRLVSRANAGDLGAQAECDNEPFVNKRLVYRKGVPCTQYKAAPEVYRWL